MTDHSIPVDEIEEPAGKANNEWTEEVSVAGGRLVETIQELLREAVVRKIAIQDKDGKTLLEIPLYAGVLGVAFLGYWSVLALIAAWFTEVSILIVREGIPDEAPAADKSDKEADADKKAAAEAASVSVNEMAGKAGSALSDVIFRASKAASDLASRAADAVEGTPAATNGNANGTAQAAQAPVAEKPAPPKESAAEPQRCQATTKAGTQCKRNALEGSDFCSTHKPA